MAKPKTQKSEYPKKGDERSPADGPDMIEGDPPALAKVFTPALAKRMIAINLHEIEIAHLRTRIVGVESLITHRWSEKALKEMLHSQQLSAAEKKLAKKNRAAKDPKADFEGARYRWEGKDWFPINGIKKAMVTAGLDLGIPKSIVQRSVFLRSPASRDYAEIKCRKVTMREDPVRVGPFNNRTADLRYRPEYHEWSAELLVQYRADVIKADQVIMLLQHAGFSVGIGEWRPERDGQHGRFEVELTAADKKKAKAQTKAVRRAA